ncbi:hypothetical protein K4F52_009978 [Lecanicillium sp. MT-2017a]|nr:hypothetical protein K4F52_009978 [Lecanicillium sp. MT-2017a]
MKVNRGIHSLEQLIGTEGTLDELAALVQERTDYSGIRRSGTPSWKMFTALFNVDTVEDLIDAENNGAYREPSDRRCEVYMFACGRGVVAKVAPGMLPQLLEGIGSGCSDSKTMEELHEEYRAMPVRDVVVDAERERVMGEIAIEYVKWACGPPKL